MEELIIDNEFQKLIPPLSEREYEGLKQSILEEGCRDRLIVWDEQNILVDGHNRYLICWNYDVPFNVLRKSFPGREAVADWIDANQLGRRNLTPDQMSLLRGRRYNRMKKASVDNLKKGNVPMGQNDPSGNTAETLAKQYGVSPKTIKRDGKAAEVIEEAGMTEAVMKGEVKKSEVISDRLKTENEPEPELKNREPPTEAIYFVMIAITQLGKIRKNDPKREEAFDRLEKWLLKHRKEK